jgi:hypothetical protein
LFDDFTDCYSFGDYSASFNSKENWFSDPTIMHMVISIQNNETKSQVLCVIYVLLYPKLIKIDQSDMCETLFQLPASCLIEASQTVGLLSPLTHSKIIL